MDTAARRPHSFTSDNAAGASPEIVQALVRELQGQAPPYGADDVTRRVEQGFARLFERDVAVFLVATGTAANSLCLATLTPPWGAVLCHPDSHIDNDECGAPQFYTHGAKLVAVDGPDCRIDPDRLRSQARHKAGDVHASQPSCVSITQATEAGSVYPVDQIDAIGRACREASLRLHIDGSRFANALVALGCTPAEMTWKAGVDALSFGATKNGAAGVEAVVLFDPSLAAEFAYRRKRGGHLLSKMRLLSAQMDAYLDGDLWLRNARHANRMAQRLARGLADLPGVELQAMPQANIVFARFVPALIDALAAQGHGFYHGRWAPGVARLVTSFATTEADVDGFVASARALASSGSKLAREV